MTAKTAAAGHTAKHVTKSKASKSTKKHSPTKTKKPVAGAKSTPVHAAAKPAKPAKARAFAVGDVLPVCAFEAVAASLRLLGQFVDDDEVAGLWELAGSPLLGASLAAALDAAGLHGLAGFRPQGERIERLGPVRSQEYLPLPFAQDEAAPLGPSGDFGASDDHALILGIDTPGPHAVLATADGWWSWGELYAPWSARVEEAWAVSW